MFDLILYVPSSISVIKGRVAQSVTCLATDASLTADPAGVASSIPDRFHTFVEIMQYFLRSFSSLPLNYSRRIDVSYKRKYVHEVLVKTLQCLLKVKQDLS